MRQKKESPLNDYTFLAILTSRSHTRQVKANYWIACRLLTKFTISIVFSLPVPSTPIFYSHDSRISIEKLASYRLAAIPRRFTIPYSGVGFTHNVSIQFYSIWIIFNCFCLLFRCNLNGFPFVRSSIPVTCLLSMTIQWEKTNLSRKN